MRSSLFLSLLVFTFIFSGCTSPAENTNSILKPANTNTTRTNSNSPLSTTQTPATATVNNAPTITPIVSGFYEALQKKDEAGARRFLSAAALKYWENEARADKKTWFAYLLESEDPVGENREVRNENTTGNTAIAEIKGGSLGVWTKIKFVRENGEWKFASPEDSPELDGVTRPASNSTAAR